MNDRAFSWCFIGTGTLAKQVAAEITETDRHRIASVYSRRSEAAEQFAKQYGGEACETPEQAMIREVLEETGRVVIPESVREFGVVVRRQRDSMDPDGIFEQRNYYYFCDVTDEIRPRMPYEHEVKEGAKPVWVEDLTEPIRCNEKAFASIGEAFLEREMRVMAMVAELLRGKSPV